MGKGYLGNGVIPMKFRDFGRCNDIHLGIHQIFDTVLMRTELVPAVDQRHLLSDGFEHECPVYRGVTAATDQYFLPAKAFRSLIK